MRSLSRLAFWGCGAAAALFLAVLAARSSIGAQRLAVAMSPAAPPQVTSQQLAVLNAQLTARATQAETETKRLAETVLALASDRDRLLTRLATVERTLEDMTGSIKRQAAEATKARVPPPASPAKEAPAQPAPAASVKEAKLPPRSMADAETSTAAPPAALAPPPPDPRSAPAATTNEPAQTATLPSNGAADPQPKVEYAVDVGGASTFEGLRTLWHTSKHAISAVVEGLHPMYVARESKRGVSLRLIVGPLPDTEAATRLCAALFAARRSCQMTVFEGQQLSLASTEQERRSSAAVPAPRPAVAFPHLTITQSRPKGR